MRQPIINRDPGGGELHSCLSSWQGNARTTEAYRRPQSACLCAPRLKATGPKCMCATDVRGDTEGGSFFFFFFSPCTQTRSATEVGQPAEGFEGCFLKAV